MTDKTNPQLPFFSTPMSARATDQWTNDRERYLDKQLDILLTAAMDDKILRAYTNGWHMRVGMN